MSVYILDTDTVTLLQRGHPGVRQRVAAHPPTEIATTIITVEEQWLGWLTRLRQAKKPDDLARAYENFTDGVRNLVGLNILSFTQAAIARYLNLVAMKINVGKPDLRIAAVTLENAGTLVTRNLRDFQRVPGLAVQNWAV